jgi:hypothetical protein
MCQTVRCRDAAASSLSPRACGIDCLACQDEFFENYPLDVKKMMSMLLNLLFTSLAFCGLGVFGLSAFFPESLSNHCQDLLAIFPRFAQNLMLFLCQIRLEIPSHQTYDSE